MIWAIVEGMAALWLVRHFIRRRRLEKELIDQQNKKDAGYVDHLRSVTERYTDMIQRYERLINKNDETIRTQDAVIASYKGIQEKVKSLEDSEELNLSVVQDAMAREERAKVALVAALRAAGANEGEIDIVLGRLEAGE